MKESADTEEQIAFAPEAGGGGRAGGGGHPSVGVAEQVFTVEQFDGGSGVGELRRVKRIEDEKQKLTQLLTDLSVDKHILIGRIEKALTPGRLREIVARVQASLAKGTVRLLSPGSTFHPGMPSAG